MSNISLRQATIINFIGRYSNVLIQLIYSAILSRILTPDDFGIVAVITVFTTFFSLIANMGIGPAVIQNKNINENDIDSIFTYTLYIGIGIGLFFTVFSLPLAYFYQEAVYLRIGPLLAISLFFNTMNIVPNSILLKSHKFKLVNIRLVVVSIISAIPTIILATIGFRYYSLIIHSILVSFITFVVNYLSVRPKFIGRLRKESLIKIKEFSTYQMGFGVINYFSRNIDNLLIGKFLGNSPLGYYDKSYRLMLYPVQNLTNVITPVLHPIFSAHQDDKEYIYKQYIKVVKILSLVGVFATAYSFHTAEELLVILFGNQWVESTFSFKYLSLAIWAQMVTSSTGSIFQSLGNAKLLFRAGIYSATLIVSSIMIGVFLGSINTVAIAVSIAYNVNMLMSFYLLIGNAFNKSVYNFFNQLLPDMVVFILTFICLGIVSKINFDNVLVSALVKLVVGSTIYILSLIVTKQYKYVSIIWRKRN
ncbi:MAG: lipopolysaccharide biosynthesis protein [Clostridiales bacterium]|nr:lipopolysaccharide biosynthesis protein [Clostridiales bacterium]